LAGSGLALGLGCGPDVDPPPELAEFCGSVEPVQLLAVGEHDYPARYTQGLQQIGDRLVFGYATYAAGLSFPSYDLEDISTTTIYSTGLCGEDPTPIGEHIDVLRAPEDGYGDALVGCRSASGDVLALDIEGGPPRLLLAGVGCTTFPYAGGIVGIQREPGQAFGRLVFRPDVVAWSVHGDGRRSGVWAARVK
jgi:hypothetical protein